MSTDAARPAEILRVEGLKKSFPVRRGFLQRTTGHVRAVDGASLALGRGKTLGLVGESGCGKSTLARMILKLLPSDGGRILFDGSDISDWPEARMKPLRRRIQIVFQDPYGSLNPRMSVGQILAEGLRTVGVRERRAASRETERLLGLVGLSARAVERYPHEFSGGQRQRIGIARALSVGPALVICDEPVSALDVSIQAQIINLLKDLQDRLGLSYLFITHDLNVVGYLCHRVAVMYRGRIVEEADAEELFANPLHPYTHTLLAAVPDIDTPRAPAPQGAPADLPEERAAPAEGCRFHPRCPQGETRCRSYDEQWVRVGEDHRVRCWKAPVWDGGGGGKKPVET
ncbi:MAG: ABC transporter ATP-binding protein [Desulfobacterales bacterium]|jgi:oligopeptide/dipeptide ABC transporter ATP-binding protein|nr:ABC transporter ATP-binding protein [Desulfobacterales bacterium]